MSLLTRFFVLLLLIGITAALYYAYNQYFAPASDNLEVPTNEATLEDSIIDTTISGTLFFSGLHGTTTHPQIYTHDLSNGAQSIYADLGAFSYDNNQGSQTYDLMIAWAEDIADIDADGYVPVWFDKVSGDSYGVLPTETNVFNQAELTSSPDKVHYAYSYRPTDGASLNISDWNIALHNYETGDVTIIEGATEPHFMDNGDLVYMKTDSFYRYTPSTGATVGILTPYENFSVIDDYDIQADTLVLAMPAARTVAVLILEDQLLTEVRRLTSQTTTYRHPVLSPDGRFFAVMAAKDQNLDLTASAGDSYTEINAAIYLTDVQLNEPIEMVRFTDFIPESVRLESWE